MKCIYILFISILISCKENTSGNNEKIISDTGKVVSNSISRQLDSLTWIQSFREFRDAVYRDDKTKVKSFFDFPVMNQNNEIWYLVYDQNEIQTNRLTGRVKPFTGSDFDKYFHRCSQKDLSKVFLN